VENELNPTTQQFITAEVSGFALKQRSKAHVTASEQFTSAKWGCAKASSNKSSRALKACGWARFARSNLAKLHKNWDCVWSTQENFRFFVMYRSPAKFCMSFAPAETLSNAWTLLLMLTTAVFEIVQRFYHATEICNVANEVSAIKTIKTVVSDKANYRGKQS